ncbi:aldehyde dehydrogenase family protein [methanogenic archaeon mixed culture ISO4-G1]|nr:aldehyde dehydrogenase family protein [methanogenic archaeon mixed culture ISO4-G1]
MVTVAWVGKYDHRLNPSIQTNNLYWSANISSPIMAEEPDFQTTEEGRKYEQEIMLVLTGEKKDYPNYFGGLKIASGHEFRICSPIDPSIQYGIFQEPEEGTMAEAVGAALKAFEKWGTLPIEERAKYFQALPGVLKARRMHYAASITVSSGMVREEALAEVDATIENLERILEEAKTIGRKRPTGVWAIISAHNSPFASPISFAVAAMIAGNTIVMNPSKYCPMPAHLFYNLMEKYGLPDGVLNLIVDRKEYTTEDLANDMRVSGVVATGSGDRLEDLMFLQVDDEMKFINEIKGMNPAIVYRPSDMKAAAKNIADSAFAFSGQSLFSCSKVIITHDDQAKFTSALTEYMKDIKIDDPVNDTAYSGPLINEVNAVKFKNLALELMPFTVAKAMPVSKELPENYVAPIAVSGLDFDNDLNFMDSGFPILNIVVVDSVDAIFEEMDNTECGLSAGLFSKDAKVIERFENEVDVPMRYVNCSSRTLKPAFAAKLENFVR